MKLNRLGYSYKYHGDEIIRYWPWVSKEKRGKYHSTLFSRDFNSFPAYWKMVGEDEALIKASVSAGDKLYGFSVLDLIQYWSARLWMNQYVVILLDVNLGSKGPEFWSRLTRDQKESLNNDIVVLRCKDKTELLHLTDSIDPSFATAYGLLNGTLLVSNEWRH